MNVAFCVAAGPRDTVRRYEPGSSGVGICALNSVPSGDTLRIWRGSPANVTAGAFPKFWPAR